MKKAKKKFDEFLKKMEDVQNKKAICLLKAFKETKALQKNRTGPAKKNTATLIYGTEQSGKTFESLLNKLKAWIQARLAPIYIVINSSQELVKMGRSVPAFNAFVYTVWTLMGADAARTPQLKLLKVSDTSDVVDYTEHLRCYTEGRNQEIPIMIMLDNTTQMTSLVTQVIPVIETYFGKTGEQLNCALYGDEGDLLYRGHGAKSPGVDDSELYKISGVDNIWVYSTTWTFVTATPRAIILDDETRYCGKDFKMVELRPSENYWGYTPNSNESKTIDVREGSLEDMIDKIVHQDGPKFALTVSSSVSKNEQLKDEAKLTAARQEKLLCCVWTANVINLYTSNAEMKKELLKLGYTATEVKVEVVAKKKEGGKRNHESESEAGGQGSKKRDKKRKSDSEDGGQGSKRKKKKLKRDSEAGGQGSKRKKKKLKGGSKASGQARKGHTSESEASGAAAAIRTTRSRRNTAETTTGEGGRNKDSAQCTAAAGSGRPEKTMEIIYELKSQKIKDYQKFIGVMGDLENGFISRQQPKVLTFAKNMAFRAQTFKGIDHKWPLDYMHLDAKESHYDLLLQTSGRLCGNDTRSRNTDVALYLQPGSKEKFQRAIESRKNDIKRLKSGQTLHSEIMGLHDAVKNALPGTQVYSEFEIKDLRLWESTRKTAMEVSMKLIRDLEKKCEEKSLVIVKR